MKIMLIHQNALLPTKGSRESVGYDVYAYLKTEQGRDNNAIVNPRTTRKISTGLIVVPPPLHVLLVCSRSGLALRSVWVANAPGVIDPDYRGELAILLYNGGHEAHYVKHGDRIAQILCIPISRVEATLVTELDETERGNAGFGSTGR